METVERQGRSLVYWIVFAFSYLATLVLASLLLHVFHLVDLVGTQWSAAVSAYLMVLFFGGLQGAGVKVPVASGPTSRSSGWWKWTAGPALVLSAGWRIFGQEAPLPTVLNWTLVLLWALAIYSSTTALANRWNTRQSSTSS